MHKFLFHAMAGCLVLAPLGCGGGIQAGPPSEIPATVTIPPPAEKPKNYGTASASNAPPAARAPSYANPAMR